MEMVVPGKSSSIPASYSHRSRLNIVSFPAGGQSVGGEITGAELQSIDKMTYGHLSMNAQLSPVHGTCQALFTYIDETRSSEAGDEQDIEMLAHKIDEGIVLTNWDPE
jgi:beta-glucanase (GH16 family)